MWDLKQLLSAFEATLRAGAKDEAAWNRTRSQIYAEPADVRKERLAAGRAEPARGGLSASGVAALLSAAAAEDAKFGAT